MRITNPVNQRTSHHSVGTARFAAIDGEGIKGYFSPDIVTDTHCIDCDSDITHNNRYWISEKGPYCHNCYFSYKTVNMQTLIRNQRQTVNKSIIGHSKR